MLPIAILIPQDYWTRTFTTGNTPGHRALPDILAALRQAGGLGQLVETGSAARPEDFAGLILPGGGDIHPRFYGQEGMGDYDPTYDAFQLAWTRAAFRSGQPILGICRGMQLLNVAAGGTLVQDIPDHMPEVPRTEPVHPIEVAPSSRLHALVEADRLPVNSIHHQGLDRLGAGLRAVAWAPDGVVEAVERAASPWQRGVQFHPEDLRSQRPFQRLFEGLVEDGSTWAS